MGVRGLTTFINNRSHLYLKKFHLHDCNVVLDGNSIASTLYKWHCKSNDCFGGDYDKFANVIFNFFSLLAQCNITPYVIFDGGYEKRKFATVVSRMKNKIRAADNLNSLTEGSDSVFPLFLREVFLDVVLELGVKVARCKFESDMEIAKIAKVLGCPVLSYDSDFYIFGCPYIPFSTVEFVPLKGKDVATKTSYTYLSCKIYKIETFLQSFGGLDQNNLPLLAVLLGNDYVKGTLFKPFFKNIKIQKCSGNQSDQQKRIKSVITWLQNETTESAIKNILSKFKTVKRQFILKNIRCAMKGYFDINSELLDYLNINAEEKNMDLQMLDELESKIEEDILNCEEESTEGEDDCSNQSSDLDNNKQLFDLEQNEADDEEENLFCKIFSENFRKCQYPSCFMDMLVQKRYYCVPQVEERTSEHSHIFNLHILSVIYKILTQNQKKYLTVISRSGALDIRYFKLPVSSVNMLTLKEIENLNIEEKKRILLDILDINQQFLKNLSKLPIDWHLFLICIQYAINKRVFEKSLIISIILCFYILHYVDIKLGFYRVSKTFNKKFAAFKLHNTSSHEPVGVTEQFGNISSRDCMFFMDKIISYFQMDLKLKTNYRLYDKSLVHLMSCIQSIFLHVKYLNSLLNYPLPNLLMHKIFDGTFIYNMTINFRKRSNINDYLEVFLKECPGILSNIKYVLSIVESLLSFDGEERTQRIRRRRRKKKHTEVSEVIEAEISDEEAFALDPNNVYSILSIV